MTTLTVLDNLQDDVNRSNDNELDPRVIVAREGTELADTLRSTGWVARAGWRTMSTDGESVWHLRFEATTDQA